MVNFLHDSMTSVMTFPTVNVPYLSSIFHNPLYLVFLFHRFVRNMKNFCSEDLFWFQGY